MNRTTRASLTLAVFAVAALASLGTVATAWATTPPSIESESASNVTSTDATLEAEINLHEAPAGAYYQFQLVTDPSEYASEILCPPTPEPGYSGCIGPQGPGALPIGFLPGNTMQPGATLHAGLDLASAGVTLQSGTAYHYRVLVARRVQTEDTIEWESPTVYGADQTFTTPAGKAPSIESESVSGITEHDATLEAAINPNGLATSYQFRLESGCLPPMACLAIAVYPLPSGELPGSSEAQQVSLDLNSAGVTLHPGTRYRYSVQATSSAGTAEGEAHIFTTPSILNAPLIESESVSNITPTDATLGAQINTEGLETTYEFHLLERWSCEELTPACYPPIRFFALPSGKLLGSFVGQSVSLDLNSAGVILSPGHNFYEYWVTATNASGTTEGHPQSFITPTESQPEPRQLDQASGSTGSQSSPAIQSPPSASPSHHRRHHRRHRRGIHQGKPYRASHAG